MVTQMLAGREQVYGRPARSHQPRWTGKHRALKTHIISPSSASCVSSSIVEPQGRIGEFLRSSGGFAGRPSDQPPQPTSGNNGR